MIVSVGFIADRDEGVGLGDLHMQYIRSGIDLGIAAGTGSISMGAFSAPLGAAIPNSAR